MKVVRMRLVNFAPVALIAIMASPSFADRVFVKPTLFSGHNPGVADSVDQYVREALTANGKHVVISDISQADYVIESTVIQYSDRVELSVNKRLGGKLLYTRTLNLAPHASIDSNTKWLVRNAVETKPFDSRYQVGTLLSTGTIPPSKRYKNKGHYYFSYGPAISDGLNNEQVMANINVGGSWISEQNLIKLYYSRTSGTNEEKKTGMSGLGFSAGQLLSHGNNPAFVNADLIWGETSYNVNDAASVNDGSGRVTKTKNGFIYGLGAGVLLLRNSKTSMEAGVQLNSFMGRTTSGVPSTVGFRVGIHF